MSGPILVAIDFSEESIRGLQHAAALAADLKARLLLVHVIEYDPAYFASKLPGHWFSPEVVTKSESDLKDLAVKHFRHVTEGQDWEAVVLVKPFPDVAIVEHAREVGARMIVVGTDESAEASDWILGSVAESISSSAPCPVLIVRRDQAPPGSA